MDQIQTIFSDNLRRLREERGLTLEQTAKRSGVSKSMLAQIERGVTSPTISTIWKISNGLKVPFTDLMSRQEAEVEIIDHRKMGPLLESDGLYRNYPLFHYAQDRQFEIYYIELDQGARLDAEPHPRGTQEYVMVFSGTLEVTMDGESFAVPSGSAIRFQADQPHTYQNSQSPMCRLHMVISYL